MLLSGERTSIPEAEAKALFLTYDPKSSFSKPEDRLLVVETSADPESVSRRVAFARRVGLLLSKPADASDVVRDRRIRFRAFSIGHTPKPRPNVARVLEGLDASVDLENPDYEFSLISGEEEYLILSTPGLMRQAWRTRRPRKRPFFHPSAIFPKLSRALVNLTRCKEGALLLDPFVGTGSILLEASEIGLIPVGIDKSNQMARGALSNMKAFRQSWLGVIRADAFTPPIVDIDGVATDVPYGRASSTGGKSAESVVDLVLKTLPDLLGTDKRLVMMHPSYIPVKPGASLRVEEEHYVYIHKKLTRAITILRKT